ncbi:hypothetical protein B0T17DRAFT_590199 [Bombardia bombarda]|uniref:Uncharacterized protein n=1 Tax=Bombardia bombarda TaxID=252184 RepID=A0AA39XC83_9PEZI|nr:hypothetical protein B0T17DRAFT_590199 [Bombardia bombarda]
MAPVAIESQPRYAPLALVASHIGTVAYLSYKIGMGLYRSHTALGPAQETRLRVSQRQKLTTAFASLAALGFALAVSSSLSYLTISYTAWASERGIEVPNSLFGGSTPSADGRNATSLHIASWLSDTPIYYDAFEIVAEKARRLWWGQQLNLAMVSWNMLLAVEGRRRNIPFLWAYSLLAHLVGLSFAQNLFYVAMLLTPSPIAIWKASRTGIPAEAPNWGPTPGLLYTYLVFHYGAIFCLPCAAGTGIFPVVATAVKMLSFAPLALHTVVPESWGETRLHCRGGYKSLTRVFHFMSVVSGLMHLEATAGSISYNLPESYKHRHSLKIPFDTKKRTPWERSTTAIEAVLGSMTDHPAVAIVGKDALLCAFSLGLWAAVRAIDVKDVLRLAAPYFKGPEVEELMKTQEQIEQNEAEEIARLAAEPSMTLRRRGRPAKSSVASISSSNGPSDEATPIRRGRPRKIKQEPTPDPEPDLEEVPGDATYEPSPEEEAELVEGDIVPDDDFDWESASLAWGLTALGGLGTGCSAVYGAECISR